MISGKVGSTTLIWVHFHWPRFFNQCERNLIKDNNQLNQREKRSITRNCLDRKKCWNDFQKGILPHQA